MHPGALLAILTIAYVLSFVDRQFLSVAIEPIRADLGLSDVQLGLLSGLAFAACYTLFGIPISALSDRSNRAAIITAGVLVWSAATAACGFAESFWQLFAARMFVGIGEAALIPAAYSLIGDHFEKADTPQATGIFGMGGAFGVGIALFGGGPLLDTLVDQTLAGRTFSPWQQSFILFGAAGIAIAVLTACIRDPRGGWTAVARRSSEGTETSRVLPFLKAERAFFVPIIMGGLFLTMFAYGYVAWVPAFFMRTYGWSATQTGIGFGLCAVVFGILSGPGWGRVATLLNRRGRDGSLVIALICTLGLLVLASIGPLMPNGWAALVFVGLVPLFSGGVTAVIPAAMVSMTPPELRARVTAVFLLCVNMTGIGFGPLLYALVTEKLLGSPGAVNLSLAIVSPLLLAPAAYLFDRARRGATR